MRRRIWAWLLFVFIAALSPGTRAQSDIVGEVRTENGLHRAMFRVPQGVIRVNFPDDMSVGDSISGTVYPEASGRNPNELARNSGEITGYVVELPGQRASGSGKRFGWTVPATEAGGVAPVLLRDRKNRIVGRCDLPINPSPSPPGAIEIDLPSGAQAGTLASVWGPFGGPSETSVNVGGQQADVIAESPRKLVFLTPADVVGQSTIQVRKGGLSASGPFSALGLRTGVTKRNLFPGETAIMSAIVSGLQGLKEPVSLVIVNHDPGTVALAGGLVQQLVIQPSEVSAAGTFELTRVLTGVKGGGFDITVTASRAPSGQIPIDRLAAHSVDSWSLAQNVAFSADARSLIVSDVVAARSQLDGLLEPQLGFRADLGTELDWLVRAYCFDLRDRKLAFGGFRGSLSPPHRPFAQNAFMPQGSAPPVRSAVSVDANDVRGYSFTRFLAQLLQRLTPSDPLGSLVVTSRPDRQTITVDQVAGADYFTTRSFVLSVGQHTVRVASCKQSVTVNPNQQATMSCPP